MKLTEFGRNYRDNANGIVRLLLIFAIYDKENINITSLENPQAIINPESLELCLNLTNKGADLMTDESKNMLKRAYDKEFSYKGLTQSFVNF